MRKIIPTVFARNKREFNGRFKKLIRVSRELQIDFMDGKFVKNKGVNLKDIPNLNGKGKFEAHLMVNYPSKYLNELKKKGFSKVIVHAESKESIEDVIEMIKKLKMKVLIAINPSTGMKNTEGILSKVDGILFMGVYPGKEKQKFVNSVFTKISDFHGKHRKISIQVDGGVNLENIAKLRKVGVNIINSGSFVSEAKNPKVALKELEKRFN